MPQHILVLVIRIADVPELDMAFQLAGVPGIRAVGFRLRVHDLAESFKACNTVLKLFHEVDQRHHRRDEHIHGNDKGGIIAEPDLAVI